jgi:hypothetical protein
MPGHWLTKMPKGMTPYEPTAEDRAKVETLASYGVAEDDICLLILNPRTAKPIAPKTLRKAFRLELNTGMVKANAKVGESLFVQAVGAPAVFDAKGNKLRAEVPRNVAAGIFWAKSRMGWSEKSKLELSGNNGGPIPLVITKNESNY